MKEELKSNYIIRIRNSTYRKTFFVLALIGIILLTSVIFPLHQLLRGEQEKNFSHLMNDKAVAVEQYVSKIMDISDQITSRSAIRNQLSLYNQGKISLEEMVNFSKPKLNDAITYSDGIEGITRLDIKGEVVLTLGENIPESVIRTSSLHSEKISVQNPISINNQLKIIVIAPIFDRNNNKLGVDIVLFNSDELRNIIKNYDNLGETGDASLIYPTNQNPFTHFFEPRRPHSHLGLAELIGQFHPTSSVEKHTLPVLENYVIMFRSVKNTDWFMFLRMQQDEFYRVVNQTILTLSVVAFTIILIGMLGVFKIIDLFVQLLLKNQKDLEKSVRLGKAANRALIAQEAKLQGITDTSQDAIVQIDAHGRTSFWNPAAERLFGYSASEALGQDLHKLIVPKRYLNQFEAGFAKFAQDGVVDIVGEIINAHAQHKDGHEFNIALSLSTLHQDGQWHAVGIIRDTTKQKQYEADLEQLAHYDPMTGLANRSSLLHYLTEKLQHKQGCDCAIFFLNIDHFRHINDSFGHDTGNAVLQEIAKRLQDNFAQLGFISHLGGDEFILVTESVQEKSDLEHLAQEMNDVLTKPYEVLEQSILHLSTSIGIVAPLQQVESAKHYLQFADIALYRAKQAGRNTYRFYHAKYVNEVNEHVRYHNALHQALDRNEFELHYQPQSYLNNDRIIGAEALLRWKHPVEGYIPPDKFIPIAEESEVISDIGAWVIDEACRQGKKWQDQGYDLHISVNVSLQQLRHQNVAQIVKNALKTSGFQAERLVVEITESVLSVDKQLLANMLHAIKAQGVSIAIDDFGTGYSSYGYMKYFPIDILKIDKIFMDNVPYEKDDAAIVVAILAMSNVLQYKVVAEGVENQDQIDFLRQQGCHYYQGFYKSPAKKAPEFQALLDKYGTSPNGFKHRKNAS